jgi:sialate O-acetylesterase
MAFTLKQALGAKEEIAASANPMLREFQVYAKTSPAPLDVVQGRWLVAGPQTAPLFTAVGYYFGKKVQRETGAPVGLIHSSWGGTPVEAWIRREAFDADPDLKTGTEKTRAAVENFPAQLQDYASRLSAWEETYHRHDTPPADPTTFAAPGIPLDDWKKITLPGSLAQAGLSDSGVIWLRRQVTVTPAMTAAFPAFDLGTIHDFDTVYWNGKKAAETTAETGGSGAPRHYYLQITDRQPGEATLAIRLVSPAGGAAVDGNLYTGPILLRGEWLAKIEATYPPLDPAARAAYPAPFKAAPGLQNTSSYLFNAMIHPLLPYAIRGVIWYQGESNAIRAFQYRTAFPLLIRDWRTQWGQGDFPFYFCQLANFFPRKPLPGDSTWAELREAQSQALSLPQTGEAILIDAGEVGSIHPRDKVIPGERLARIALGQTYGKNIVWSGPVFTTASVEGDAMRIHFTHTEGGLVARPLPATIQPNSLDPATVPLVRNSPKSSLEGFSLCGADHLWQWADAEIDGDFVIVRSSSVPHPVAVRYGWADDPICNFYNGAGLPAGPFRSDDLPLSTEKNRLGF